MYKWVYRIKYNVDGSVGHHKARLVVMGNFQEERGYYFALVIKMNTIQILLEVAATKRLETSSNGCPRRFSTHDES